MGPMLAGAVASDTVLARVQKEEQTNRRSVSLETGGWEGSLAMVEGYPLAVTLRSGGTWCPVG